jgi:ATP-dependent exoDNAse (exonuclease V) beta subunit
LKASHLGTQVHEYAQSLFEETNYKFTDEDVSGGRRRGLCLSVDKAVEILKSKYEFIEAEKIVFSTKINIAGTVDLLMVDHKSKTVFIFDWKSNEKIKRDNFFQNATSPICDLEDCAFNKYQLQLSLYKHIIEKEEYFPGYKYKMMLIHLEQIKICWIIVDDLNASIVDMLAWI